MKTCIAAALAALVTTAAFATAQRTTTDVTTTRARTTRARTTRSQHPSCSAQAATLCQDECRGRNNQELENLLYSLLGFAHNGSPDTDPYAGIGGSALDVLSSYPDAMFENFTDAPSRRRRGVLPPELQDQISAFLRQTTRCADAKLKQDRDGVCTCNCASEPLQLDCGLLNNGGFTDGTSWETYSKGVANSQVTNDQCWMHNRSPLPLGNYNYECLVAGADFPFPFNSSYIHTSPHRKYDREGKVVLQQRFKIPDDINHAFLLYGFQPAVVFGDYGFLFVGPNVQGYRVDITKHKSAPFSTNKKDIVDPLLAGRGYAPPNLYLHDLTKSVGNGGAFNLRYMVASAFSSQTAQIDHVHMCTVKCGGSKRKEKKAR